MIPEDLRALFWDVNLETFNPLEYSHYTIFRILELGDRPAVVWLKANFSEEQIKNVIRNERLITSLWLFASTSRTLTRTLA